MYEWYVDIFISSSGNYSDFVIFITKKNYSNNLKGVFYEVCFSNRRQYFSTPTLMKADLDPISSVQRLQINFENHGSVRETFHALRPFYGRHNRLFEQLI